MKNSYRIVFIAIVLLILSSTFAQAQVTERIFGRYVVRSIDFNFVGKRTYKDKRLLGILSFKINDSIDAVQAEFGRADIEEFYLKKGFAFAQVTLDKKKLSEGKVIYTITEGPRVKIESVNFSGNNAIKTKALKTAIKTKKKKWFLWPSYYTEARVDEDVERLKDIYYERGFLDYSIRARRDFTEDKSKVHITFAINEGPVYTVEKIVLTGAAKIYDIDINGHFDEKELRAKLKLKEGQIYGRRKAESDAKQLLKLYREYGFIDADVRQRPEFVSEIGVNVEFEIREGRQFRIGRIDITGNEQTHDKVIRRILDEYEFQPGRWYNADMARGDGSGELEREIRRMVLMEATTITPLASEQPGQKHAEVSVKEGQTGFVMLGAGVGSDVGFIGQFVVEQRNFDISDWPESFGEFITGQAFKGAGQSLRISLQPGTEVSEYLVSFREPYFRDKPISLDVTGSSWERERESYEEDRLKGYVGFAERYGKRDKDRWRRSIGFRAEDVDVEGIDFDAPKEIKDVKGDNTLVGVRLGIGKDLTDDRFNPSEGYHLDASYEQAAGDHTFGILSGTYRRYSTLYEDLAERKTILATRLHAATVLGDAPPFEKFYAGGMYSIRGFDYRGVSTRGTPEVGGVRVPGAKKKDPIGSDWIFLASAEVTVPLVGEGLAALFFVDSGTIDSGSYRAAVGTGIQILIPQWFGPVPMSIGIAVPFLKDDSDDTEAFFFSVGRLF